MPSRFKPFAGAGVPQVGEESRPVITCGSLTGFRSGAPPTSVDAVSVHFVGPEVCAVLRLLGPNWLSGRRSAPTSLRNWSWRTFHAHPDRRCLCRVQPNRETPFSGGGLTVAPLSPFRS